MRRIAKQSSSASSTTQGRLRLSLTFRQQLPITKRRIATETAATRMRYSRHLSGSIIIRNETSPFDLLYGDCRGYNTCISSINNNNSKRLFCSATGAGTTTSHKSKAKKGTRQSNTQRKKTPKQLSYKRNNHDRIKPLSSKVRRSSNHRKLKYNNNNNNNNNINVSKIDHRGNQSLPDRKHLDSNKNYGGVNSSIASSIVDKWDDTDGRNDRMRDGRSVGGYNNSRTEFDHDNGISSSRRRNNNNNNTFQLDRFLDKQQEFCESLEDYRLFWYPGSDHQKRPEHPQHPQQPQHQQQQQQPFHSDTNNDWKTAVAFEHPDPNENFPWLDLSWEKVVESEDLFRRVCSSHHDLFVSCSSYLTDLSETNNHTHYQNNNNTHYQNNNNNNNNHRNNDEDLPEENSDFFAELHNQWTEQDLLRAECEVLLAEILPSWERLRRERALLVEAYRPHEENNGDDECDDRDGDEDHLLPPQVSYEEQPPDHSLNELKQDTIATTTPPDTSYQNNHWVGWLKEMITGNNDQATDEDHLLGDDEEPFERVTAHSDPECAPNHYHYTKLVGRLYFHFLPLEIHNRLNPFHLYSKSEREREHLNYAGEVTRDDGNSSTELDNGTFYTINSSKIPYKEALADWEEKRIEILGKRAQQMQYIVDQSLLPLTPNRNNNGTSVSKPQHENDDDYEFENSSDRVLTDKIVRLLIRSYLDMESLFAAQQAERVYHRHPNHRKRLLWYVTMCYLKVISTNNKEVAAAAAASNARFSSNNGRNNNNNNNNNNHHHQNEQQQPHQKDFVLQRKQESSTAAKRICELVSSKHAKEAREFQHCSTIAFEALAILPPYGRRGLKGYYDRVHSLGILKFGPRVWEALLHPNNQAAQASHNDQDGGNSNSDRSKKRRKRKTNRKPSLDSSTSHDRATQPQTQPQTLKQRQISNPPIDLSQSLHSKDHRILSYLIQIYSHEAKDLHRALRLLKVSLDLYSPHDLNESLDRSTFHKLLRKLSEQKRKASLEHQKKQKQQQQNPQNKNNENHSKSNEFETALGLLDSMVSDESWFPNEETFRILFSMIFYSENPGRDAERLRSKLEACRFLSGLTTNQHRPAPRGPPSSGEQGLGVVFPEAPHLLNPLEASALTLRAWLQTLQQHGGILPPSEANPSQRALAILKAMKVGSSSLFPPYIHNNNNNNNSGVDDEDGNESDVQTEIEATINPPPTAALYSLALEVCSRDGGSPRTALNTALDIFGFLRTDGLLLEGSTCMALLGVLADFSNTSNASPEDHHDLMKAKVEAVQRVCEALADEDPCYWQNHPPILEFLQQQSSHLRLRHPDLYEEYLAEFKLLDEQTESKEDGTTIEGLGGGENKSKA